MPLKHLTPEQWDTVDAGTPDQETRDHLATCEECRAVVAESRALLLGLRRRPTRPQGLPLATNHPAAEDLAAYGDGVLFEAGARSIEEHLDHCADCRDDIMVMRDVAAAGDLRETVSPKVRAQLLERLSRSGKPERVTALGGWLVKVGQKVGAVFSPLADGRMAAADMVMASLRRAKEHHAASSSDRSKLEAALAAARGQAERARTMMEHATEMMRQASGQVEEILRVLADDQEAQFAAMAATVREAIEEPRMRRDADAERLEVTAADLQLRIEARDRDRPDLFAVTVFTQDGQPVPGVALEVRSPDGEPTLRTTNAKGWASFSLPRGESTLRLRRHGVWELQLARQS